MSDLGSDMEMKPANDIVMHDRRGTLANYIEQEPRKVRDFVGITRHHRPTYDDYNLSKLHIMQMLGNIHGEEGLNLIGRQICVAVFCRPSLSPGGIILPITEIKEDWWQHKVVLLVAIGPDAFGAVTGNEKYFKSQFGERRPPQVGDWVFMNASSGTQIFLCGEGASRPQAVDTLGREYDVFEWNGWPCRILQDDSVLGWIGKPHQII